MLLLALLLTLQLAACNATLPAIPAQPPVAPPEIPAPPEVTQPPPSGTYWGLYCKDISLLRRLLRLAPLMSGVCSERGQMVQQGK